MSAKFSFLFSVRCMGIQKQRREEERTGGAHTGPVLKKSNPESEDYETWEKEKVFSNGF